MPYNRIEQSSYRLIAAFSLWKVIWKMFRWKFRYSCAIIIPGQKKTRKSYGTLDCFK